MPALQSRLPLLAAGVVTAALVGLLTAAPPPARPQPQVMGPGMSAPRGPQMMMPAPGQFQPARAQPNMGMGSPLSMSPSMGRPFAPAGFGSSYGMGSQGYGGAMSGSYGAPAYGAGGQGTGYGGGRNAAGAGTEDQADRQERDVSKALTASGVPNEDGRLLWPVGLRALPSREAEELRRQIDALMQEQAEQARAGPVNANVDEELARATRALRKVLRRDEDERFSLPLTAYEDAEEFLAKLQHAEKLLRAGLEPPGDKARLEARAGKVAEVGLHDNHFDPKTLTVPEGTTVRWTNQGKHGHTVTSDKADWGSKELGPGSSYSH